MGFTVLALEPEDLAAFIAAADRHQAVERQWLTKTRKAADELPTKAARAEARRGVRAELARLRETGELLGTRGLVIASALRRVLTARGLAGEYKPMPPGTTSRGRPVGDSDRKHGHFRGSGGYQAELLVDLPDELEEQLRRAVYWHTWEVIEQLYKWADKWGESPELRFRQAQSRGVPAVLAMLAAAMAPRAGRAALEEREQLRAQIITTGDLLRAAVKLAAAELPEELPLGAPGGPSAEIT